VLRPATATNFNGGSRLRGAGSPYPPPAAFTGTGASYGTLHTSLEGAPSETAHTGIHVAKPVKAPTAGGCLNEVWGSRPG
jgi:hypothetical protein